MAKTGPDARSAELHIPTQVVERLPLWDLDVVELTGHNWKHAAVSKSISYSALAGVYSTLIR
ncbi:MAG TPA: hypothetical protein VKW78_12365 [Terriglobales bacterium]|jgi:hypothetical protein|nr:hypothetical protein [Terriglobales bacterium]HZP31805.1 hypothetical protein [Candidatus Acidoferrales bacterium]